jgi:ribonuclease Y
MILLANMEWVAAAIGLLTGAALGVGLKWLWELATRRRAHEEASRLLEATRREADALRAEARKEAVEEAARLREETEKKLTRRRQELETVEQRLAEREQLVNEQLAGIVKQEQALGRQRESFLRQCEEITRRREELAESERRQRRELERIAGLSAEAARAELLHRVEQETLKDAADLSRHLLENARETADAQARRIVSMAVQRYAGAQNYELTTASVALNGISDIKGRIIGRDGRNIRAFEARTGVTVLIDDTPNTVVLSGFDPVRRETARRAMEILVTDGRIHPTRIEEVVAEVEKEVEQAILEAGRDALFRLGLHPVHDEVLRLLGRLRFRQSYSQNILDHSIEVAHLAALMAAELDADLAVAKRAGLLHDIGKAINHEVEGSHALIGADFLKRHGEPEEIVNAVAAHHDEVPPNGIVAVLISAADALSASRPGARSESMTHYLKRLQGLEEIGGRFAGVDKCYAVQAGRELRVIVRPEELSDEAAEKLARDIAHRIEEELQYPGQIKVTVVRESRATTFAK